jgi:hypothetical protein
VGPQLPLLTVAVGGALVVALVMLTRQPDSSLESAPPTNG